MLYEAKKAKEAPKQETKDMVEPAPVAPAPVVAVESIEEVSHA